MQSILTPLVLKNGLSDLKKKLAYLFNGECLKNPAGTLALPRATNIERQIVKNKQEQSNKMSQRGN